MFYMESQTYMSVMEWIGITNISHRNAKINILYKSD